MNSIQRAKSRVGMVLSWNWLSTSIVKERSLQTSFMSSTRTLPILSPSSRLSSSSSSSHERL